MTGTIIDVGSAERTEVRLDGSYQGRTLGYFHPMMNWHDGIASLVNGARVEVDNFELCSYGYNYVIINSVRLIR